MVDHATLGKTGLRVSVAGLGCGGHSRLGQRTGATTAQSISIVRRALDLGVNFIDTARAYRTEEIVGKAIAGRRDQVVISTKVIPQSGDALASGDDVARSLEGSLRRLGTDYVDVYHLHGVTPEQYDHCVTELVPALARLRAQGKLRFIGITERFTTDPQHAMLRRALADDCWEVVMVGYSLLNPSARERVFQLTSARGIGTLVMFAVRRLLSRPEELRKIVAELLDSGRVPEGSLDRNDPLGFLIRECGANSVMDAAYRFCHHTEGADVILTGTGSLQHLEQNLASLSAPPLPARALERLERAFGTVDFLSGN